MRQFVGIIIAFILLPVMLKVYPKVFKGKKAPLGPILFTTGLIMAVIAGLGINTMVEALKKVFTTASKRETLLVVLEIGILGSIMKQYGILDKIVNALAQIIPSKKTLIMTLPAIMGLLPVPGGAYLSAPFVDSVGNDLGISGERKSVINMYFRHFSAFVLPYNTTMLTIISILPDVNVYTLIGLCLPFVFVLLFGAYLCYVKDAPKVASVRESGVGAAVKDVVVYLSPVYMAMVFNAVLGISMYQAIFLCILLTFFLIGKDKSMYLKSAVKGISIDTVLMLVGVYFMQNIVQSLDLVMSGVGGLLVGQSSIGFIVIVAVVGLAFGLSTGMSLVPMGILLPFVAGMGAAPMTQTVYAMFILMWSFLGYYYSPFHLCQLLTVKYMDADTNKVYKLHTKMMPWLVITTFVLFFAYSAIFA